MNDWPGKVEHRPTCLDVMTCTCITAAEFNAYDSVCERLAEAVRLLTTLKSGTCWCGLGTGHPLIRNHDQTCYDTEAFLAKEKEKGNG